MVRYAIKIGVHTPYTIPHKGPIPKIEKEEGLPPGGLDDIAWVNDSRKHLYHWSEGLQWYERLYAHATLNSIRKNFRCKRPFAPRDSLDYALASSYCPVKDVFFEKTDPCLQKETVFGEDINLYLENEALCKKEDSNQKASTIKPKFVPKEVVEPGSWRQLRNRVVYYPDKPVPRDSPLRYSNGGISKRENIYNVKLGIAADHTPQTNPGYSRTPSGAFYSI